MSTPQQPELRRHGHNPADPDAPATTLTGQGQPASGTDPGPVPEDNRPGHHPEHEQDKPEHVPPQYRVEGS